MADGHEPIWINAAAVGELLSVSQRTVWAMHSSGQLGPQPIRLSSRCTRWDRRELERWTAASAEVGRPIPRRGWAERGG